jgi:hypothetical protein
VRVYALILIPIIVMVLSKHFWKVQFQLATLMLLLSDRGGYTVSSGTNIAAFGICVHLEEIWSL